MDTVGMCLVRTDERLEVLQPTQTCELEVVV